MHRRDRTMPLGMGTLTKKRLGYCSRFKNAGYLNAINRRDFTFERRNYRYVF